SAGAAGSLSPYPFIATRAAGACFPAYPATPARRLLEKSLGRYGPAALPAQRLDALSVADLRKRQQSWIMKVNPAAAPPGSDRSHTHRSIFLLQRFASPTPGKPESNPDAIPRSAPWRPPSYSTSCT